MAVNTQYPDRDKNADKPVAPADSQTDTTRSGGAKPLAEQGIKSGPYDPAYRIQYDKGGVQHVVRKKPAKKAAKK